MAHPKNTKLPEVPPPHAHDASGREHWAWRQLCKHLAAVGVDINGREPLACAIRLWGEELVALREAEPEHTEAALREKRNEYRKHVIDDGAL